MRDHRDRTIRPRREGGFTLAEVLIASTVSMIVLIGLYLLYDVNQATLIRGEQQTDLQQNARIGMDRIVRELRLVGSDPSGTLSPGGPLIPGATTNCAGAPAPQAIEIAEATCVRFYADVDSVPPPLPLATERGEYSDNAATQRLRRQVWTAAGTAGAQPLAERVTALTIAYYDAAGNLLLFPIPAGSLGSIRRISVIITTADTVTGRVPQPYTLRAEIRPRNLGLRP
ncbi:MAG: prepilin-type N-terminal cleavage/methylation domain-containing protein [candidate division NC10 bacterium]